MRHRVAEARRDCSEALGWAWKPGWTRPESISGRTRGGRQCGLRSLWLRCRTAGTGGRSPGPQIETYGVAASQRMERSLPPTTSARANPYTMGLGERLRRGRESNPRDHHQSWVIRNSLDSRVRGVWETTILRHPMPLSVHSSLEIQLQSTKADNANSRRGFTMAGLAPSAR